jgi:HK97 family phage major capsid protein
MSEFIKNLSEQRARAWEQAKGLLDHAATEARDLSAEESEQFDRINAELDTADARIKSVIDAEQRNRDIEESRARLGVPADLGATVTASVENSDEDTVRSLMNGEIRSARFEKRAITSSSSGGAVPTSVYDRIVEHLVQTNVVRNVATIVTTNTGETLNVPTSTAFSTASIVGEAAQASASDPTLATRALGAYKYTVLVQLSNELASDGAVDVAGFLARQAGTAIGVATRGHMTTGDGSSKPTGIVTSSTAGKTGSTSVSGAFTGDNLIDLRYSVGSAYTSQPGCGFMMNNTAMAAARKLKGTANDHYIFAPGMNGDPDQLLGFPVYLNDSMANPAVSAKSVLFGHFPSYYIREVNGIDVAVSDDFAFDYSVRTFRVQLRTDGLLIDQTGAVKHFVGGAS